MDEKIEKVIELIKNSDLDQTIKDILIRDVQAEGLTDFLKEQIKAYCVDRLKKIDEEEAQAIKILEEQHSKNPAQ